MKVLQACLPALTSWLFAGLFCSVFLLQPADANADGMSDVQAAICSRLTKESSPFTTDDLKAVTVFYTARDCRPVWVDARGLTRAASRAVAEIKHAADWGLDAADFKFEAINKPFTSGQWSSDETANAEFEITAAILRYAQQAQGGRIPEPETLLSSYIDREPAISSAADVLSQTTLASDPGAVLRSYQPHQEQFLKLKELLAGLRGKADDAVKFDIAKRGPMLRLGSRDPAVNILKRRFGIASEPGSEEVFDQALADAIKKFQESVSLHSDGIIGPATRAALSRNVSDKIASVIANMEEWRWMPRSLGATHILVNVPAFSITLTQNDRTIFENRVIVGTPTLQTPLFSKDMTTIVLRPQWYLPNSIKLRKLLSGRSLESQGYVIKRNGRRVSSSQVNWARANLSAYTVYQPSGSDNALGLVKFLFPNKHAVYLHDTPSKSLFNHDVRLFSHGCVRVRNPLVLAQRILDIDRGDAAPNVERLAHKGPKTNHITLDTPIPVHIGYFTVWVDDSGVPHYYKDYYGHQQRITLALAGKWDEIDVGKDHLAAVDTSKLREVSIGLDPQSGSADGFNAPMGLSNTFGSAPSRDSVGDMIRRALGH